ncbi:MAG: hypothetical protein SGPRY_000075 [Prymnesium sp.]
MYRCLLLPALVPPALSGPRVSASRIVVPREIALPHPTFPSPLWKQLRRIFAAEAEDALGKMLPVAPREADSLPSDWSDQSGLRDALEAAGFSPFTQRDLRLSRALNEDYLFRLSIEPSLSRMNRSLASDFYGDDAVNLPLDGRVVLFHRGYETERVRGRLLLEKLDYLQVRASHACVKTFRTLARPNVNAERHGKPMHTVGWAGYISSELT